MAIFSGINAYGTALKTFGTVAEGSEEALNLLKLAFKDLSAAQIVNAAVANELSESILKDIVDYAIADTAPLKSWDSLM